MARFPPPEVLASWPQANLVDPQTRRAALPIVNYIFLVPCIVVVPLRVWCRWKYASLWWDDLFVALALIVAVPLSVITSWANDHLAWNKHEYDITDLDILIESLKWIYVCKILFGLSMLSSRMSMICFYHRLCDGMGKQHYRRILNVCLVFTLAFNLIYMFMSILDCRPIGAYWSLIPVKGASCINEGVALMSFSAINAVIDLVITLAPIPVVMTLTMPYRHRVGVSIMLSVGGVVVIAGFLRVYFIYKALVITYDETWWTAPIWICTTVEVEMAIVCACAPTLNLFIRPIVSKMFHRYVPETYIPETNGRPSVTRKARLRDRLGNMVAFDNWKSKDFGSKGLSTTMVTSGQWTEIGKGEEIEMRCTEMNRKTDLEAVFNQVDQSHNFVPGAARVYRQSYA